MLGALYLQGNLECPPCILSLINKKKILNHIQSEAEQQFCLHLKGQADYKSQWVRGGL